MRFWKLFSDRQKKASTYNGLLLSKRTSSVCPTSLHIKEFFCQTASATSFILYPRVFFFFSSACWQTEEGKHIWRNSSVKKDFFCQTGLLLSKGTSCAKKDFFCLSNLIHSTLKVLFSFSFFLLHVDRQEKARTQKEIQRKKDSEGRMNEGWSCCSWEANPK